MYYESLLVQAPTPQYRSRCSTYMEVYQNNQTGTQ